MTGTAGQGLEGLLDAAESASPVDAVEAVTRQLGLALGATAVSFLVADLSGQALVRMTHALLADPRPETSMAPAPTGAERVDGEESATVLAFDGGPAERALRSQRLQVVRDPGPAGPDGARGGFVVLAPVTERGEAIGLVEMRLPVEPTAAQRDDIARTALVLAYVVIASRRHTDLFEWGQRSVPFSLSAEIQRRLLPSAFTCEAGAFTLSAWLEPAASIAGDTFDYALARDVLHLSMTDAMGHGVSSALTATLCLGALRNSRRLGGSLEDQAAAANAALDAHATDELREGFATGVLGRVDLRSGRMQLLNAGHVPPYLSRDGTAQVLELPPGLPLGMFPEVDNASVDVDLLPGDRLVFVTDGMLERCAGDVDLAVEIAATRQLHPREATRALADLVIAASGGALADDATLMVLDWHGGHGRDRRTASGAETHRASSAS